jgi:hypothetical protein
LALLGLVFLARTKQTNKDVCEIFYTKSKRPKSWYFQQKKFMEKESPEQKLQLIQYVVFSVFFGNQYLLL